MGIRFGLGTESVVAYLTSHADRPPRLTVEAVLAFLQTLAYDDDLARPRLISSSPDWISSLRDRARKSLEELYSLSCEKTDVLDASQSRHLLDPLAEVLGNYDVYVVPVGTWRDSDILDRFSVQAAKMPGRGILVLIPDYYSPGQHLTALDPSTGATEAATRRELWPGAIFFLRTGESRFVPLDVAYEKLIQLNDIIQTYGSDDQRGERLQQARAALDDHRLPEVTARQRLIHLSDLHLGTDRAAQTQTLLQLALQKEVQTADRIVITGDLFDQPKRRHAQQFVNFQDQLRIICKSRPILVPGNHDQRMFGNSILGLGRKLRQVADLRWEEVVVDEPSKMVFFCFDSSRSGDFARGEVSTDQLVRVATQYELANADDHLADYLKIALVHHHPYAYSPDQEIEVLDPSTWFSKEDFLSLRNAETFLSWCAGRSVSLVLHGHKHIPRLIHDFIPGGDNQPGYAVSTVGCGSSLGAGLKPLSFNVVEWVPDLSTWSVDFRIDRGDGQGFRSVALSTDVAQAV